MAKKALNPKDFKHALSKLKSEGLLPSDLNVSKARPWWVRSAGPRGGKYTLSELVDKYDDVVSDKARVIELPPAEVKKYTKLKYEKARGNRIIVPHTAVEKVVKTPDGFKIKDVAGITRIPVPVEYHNLPQFLNDFAKDARKIEKMKQRGTKFAMRIYDGHTNTYDSLEDLLEAMMGYESTQAAMEASPAAQKEFYRHLEFLEVRRVAWNQSRKAAIKKAVSERKAKPGQRKRTLDKLKKGPQFKLDIYREKRAAQQREYRAKLKGKKLTEYKKDARERAKRSWKGRKK